MVYCMFDVSLVPVILYAAEAVILGFQHFIVMLGTTVIIPSALVPQMGGGNVSPQLFIYALPNVLCFIHLHINSTSRKK